MRAVRLDGIESRCPTDARRATIGRHQIGQIASAKIGRSSSLSANTREELNGSQRPAVMYGVHQWL